MEKIAEKIADILADFLRDMWVGVGVPRLEPARFSRKCLRGGWWGGGVATGQRVQGGGGGSALHEGGGGVPSRWEQCPIRALQSFVYKHLRADLSLFALVE